MLKLLWYLGDRQKKHEHVALNQPSRGKLRHIKKIFDNFSDTIMTKCVIVSKEVLKVEGDNLVQANYLLIGHKNSNK